MKRLIAIILAGLFLAGALAGCAPDPRNNDSAKKTDAVEEKDKNDEKEDADADGEKENDGDESEAETEAKTEKDDQTVKGKWVLTEKRVKREREEYKTDEFHSVFSVDVYEHTYTHTYTPDKEDPTDGTTPYSASYFCDCTVPDALYPGENGKFTLTASVDYDDKPGSNDGICCSMDFWGITPEPTVTSSGGYDYSQNMYYPICAGSTISYGHMEDTEYVRDTDDTIYLSMPVITKDMRPASYETLTVTFMSNAGDSEFIYTWVGED